MEPGDITLHSKHDACIRAGIRFYYVDNGPGHIGWEWHDVDEGEAMSEGLFSDPDACIVDAHNYLPIHWRI